MSQNNTQFREELAWNSYFVENIHEKVYEEVQFAAQQFEEETNTTISDEEIDTIVEEIIDDGLSSLTEGHDRSD